MTEYTDKLQVAFLEERERLARLFLSGLSPHQLEFAKDPHRVKVARCGRRAGKTYLFAHCMGKSANECRNGLVGYITKTRDWARDLVWMDLQRMNDEKDLGGKANEGRLEMTYPCGSTIMLGGAKDRTECEKFRGLAYRMIVLDEAGSFAPDVLEYITREILPAALGDYRGTLIVGGTPNDTCEGYFHDMDTDPTRGAHCYHWTVRENPNFPRWRGMPNWQAEVDPYLAEERQLYGLQESDPAYMREYLGEWVRDETEFIYHMDRAAPWEEPPANLHHVLGLDLGWRDSTAFVDVGYSQELGKVWAPIEEWDSPGQTFDDIKLEFDRFVKAHHPERAVVDPPGEGKIIRESLAAEMWTRFGIEVQAAEKSEKGAFMRIMDSAIRTGKLLVKPGSKFWHQLRTLQWDKHRNREAEGQPCDLHDAGLYAFRNCWHWISLDKKQPLDPQQKMKADFLSREQARAQEEI